MPVTAAKQLASQGVPDKNIFYQTGWFRGADGTWQWVLPDRGAALNRSNFDVTPAVPPKVIVAPYKHASGAMDSGYTRPGTPETLALRPGEYKLPDVLQHPALYQAYPKLADATVSPLPAREDKGSLMADYNPATNKVRLASGRSEQELTSTLLHELEHGVQKIEGFAPGGGDSMFLPTGHYSQLDAVLKSQDTAKAEAAKTLGQDDANYLMYYLRRKLVYSDNDPSIQENLNRLRSKLPADVYDQATKAAAAQYPLELDEDSAFQKYQNLAGETQSRKVQAEYEGQNWDQYPPDMPGFVPGNQQLIRDPSAPYHQPILTTPGKQYDLVSVDHDPFAAPAGSSIQLTPVGHDPFTQSAPPGPVTLTPVDQDPFAMPNTSLPSQSQMPVPVMPATAITSTSDLAAQAQGNQPPMPQDQPMVQPVNTVTQ
jgi:hypothetical protein